MASVSDFVTVVSEYGPPKVVAKAVAKALHNDGDYKTAALSGLTQDIQTSGSLRRRWRPYAGHPNFRELKEEMAALRGTSKASGS